MAWIESHQRLKNDPKLRRFCRALGVLRPHGIGMVHELWWYALDHAENGDLSRIDKRDIALEMEWPEDKFEDLWKALIEKGPPTAAYPDGEPGFVEESGLIHAWLSFAGRLMKDRDRQREKRRLEREAIKESMDLPGLSNDGPAVSGVDPTKPNPTQPNQKKVSSPTEEMIEAWFVEFWKAYPHKVDKKAARRAWGKIKFTGGLFSDLMKALEAWKQSRQWVKDDGEYIPYPATWLNGARWENSPGKASSNGKSSAGSAAPRPKQFAHVGKK